MEARSDSSSGRQWLQRTGLGRLKHIDCRLCWLQSAIRKKVLSVLPIGTKLNLADLNTKRLSEARRNFLLYYLGAVRIGEDNAVKQAVGQTEHWEHVAEEAWKCQVKRISRWCNGRGNRKLINSVMLAQAFGLHGCMDGDSHEDHVEQDAGQLLLFTALILVLLGVCNFLYEHWHVLTRLFARRGTKRPREEEAFPDIEQQATPLHIPVGPSPSTRSSRASREVTPRPPVFPPMPADPPDRWEPWSPEWFTYFMLGRVNRRIERRGGRMSESDRRKYEKRQCILASQLSILAKQRSGTENESPSVLQKHGRPFTCKQQFSRAIRPGVGRART